MITKIFKNYVLKVRRPFFIGIYIDYDNLEIGLNKFQNDLHFEYPLVLKYLGIFGIVKFAIAYGDWSYFKIAAQILSSYGVSLKHKNNGNVRNKNLTDPQMTSDICEMVYTDPEIDLYVICSGDAHFLPAIWKIKKQPNKRVFVISEKNSLNCSYRKLPNVADKVITYQELFWFLKI